MSNERQKGIPGTKRRRTRSEAAICTTPPSSEETAEGFGRGQQAIASTIQANTTGIETVTIPLATFERIMACLPPGEVQQVREDILALELLDLGDIEIAPIAPSWLDDFSPVQGR